MRRPTGPLRLVLALAVCAAPSGALASEDFIDDVPNGETADGPNCSACHTIGANQDAFGQAVKAQRDGNGGVISWPALYSGDADGDEFTNGEELGDPCGVWTPGATPAFATFTDPGNPASKPAAHTVDTCNPGSSSSSGGSSSGEVSSSSSSGGDGDGGAGSSSSGDGRYKARKYVEEDNGCGPSAITSTDAPTALLVLAVAVPLLFRRRR
ncbi:MAG: hypothetical protein AB2A00_21690 [Myxococcota bacterium]